MTWRTDVKPRVEDGHLVEYRVLSLTWAVVHGLLQTVQCVVRELNLTPRFAGHLWEQTRAGGSIAAHEVTATNRRPFMASPRTTTRNARVCESQSICTRHPLASGLTARCAATDLRRFRRGLTVSTARRPTPNPASTILRKFLLFDWWTQISDN
jgi:hypothetical protein